MKLVGVIVGTAIWATVATLYHVYGTHLYLYSFLLCTFILGVEIGMIVMRGYIDVCIEDALELRSHIDKTLQELQRVKEIRSRGVKDAKEKTGQV
jgi:hypothetical protein